MPSIAITQYLQDAGQRELIHLSNQKQDALLGGRQDGECKTMKIVGTLTA